MEHLLLSCSICHGTGMMNISTHQEPFLADYAGCDNCEGKGYTYCDDDIDERKEIIDSLIEGMITRLSDLSKWSMECKRGGLDNLAEKYLNRMDTCARGLARLKSYRAKLIKL